MPKPNLRHADVEGKAIMFFFYNNLDYQKHNIKKKINRKLNKELIYSLIIAKLYKTFSYITFLTNFFIYFKIITLISLRNYLSFHTVIKDCYIMLILKRRASCFNITFTEVACININICILI